MFIEQRMGEGSWAEEGGTETNQTVPVLFSHAFYADNNHSPLERTEQQGSERSRRLQRLTQHSQTGAQLLLAPRPRERQQLWSTSHS